MSPHHEFTRHFRASSAFACDIPDADIHTTENPILDNDIVQEHGFRITTLGRSIVDSARRGTDPKQIQMAITTARRRRVLSETELANALENAPQRVPELVPQ